MEILIISGLGLLSFILTYLIRRFALSRDFLDIPNSRSLHDHPTPKGGGLAIVITWYAGISIFFLLGLIDGTLYLALLCGVVLAIVSLIDDLRGLSPVFRLIIQFITSITAFWILGGLRPLVMPGIHFNYNFITYPVAVTGMVWFINLYNFMDGVDGFASMEAIIVSFALIFFSRSIIPALVIASVTGFLFWNWPKAKIFMGDVGSTQLGFILVVLGIYFHNMYKFSILNWIMLLSPFWFDATFTLFRRIKNGERLGTAHRKHAYQRYIQAGYSHLQMNIWLIIVNVLIILIILFYREFKFIQIALFVLTLISFFIFTRFIDKKIPFRKD